jgi:uncharacterized membrane protein YtjA (UPF0391 family)
MGLLIAVLILAIISAVLGFSGIASTALVAFWVLLAVLIILAIIRLVTGRWLWG